MHRIGIMQGRLSPVRDGKIQTFPKDTWRDEFALAKDIGYELIEWVLDTELAANPLLSPEGRKEMNTYQQQYNITVPSVCCDYFVEYPFHSPQSEIRLQSHGMLLELIRVCPEAGIKLIELPLIGASSIREELDASNVVLLFNDLVPLLEKKDMCLVLETDLPPDAVGKLLAQMPSERIQVNYDTGNSAYWKFNAEDELSTYGSRIGNIHIKDCTPKDYSVALGSGNVDFDLSFNWFKKVNYKGDFILQAARGPNDIDVARMYYQFTRSHIYRFFNTHSG
jgi:L-ribulose-5-phosphate 3-epimerase